MYSAASTGVTRYAQWKQKFLQQWLASVQAGQVKAMFASLPPQLKEAMMLADRAMYDRLAASMSQR
jgi:hypothetical protein